MTKATIAEGDQMRYGPNWLLSRRGTLKVFDDHLECGDWRVDYGDIREAVLYSVRSNFIFPCYVLKVAALGDHPLGRWIEASVEAHEMQLPAVPRQYPLANRECDFPGSSQPRAVG